MQSARLRNYAIHSNFPASSEYEKKTNSAEFVSEFDKEIRKKEHMCPHCGALMGSGNTCAKCGYKGH